MTTYKITLEEDPDTGDLLLPLSDAILAEAGWKEGDTLVWKDEGNGSFSISKKVENGQENP